MRRPLPAALTGLLMVLAAVGGCTDRSTPSCGDDDTGPVTFATAKNLTEGQRTTLTQRWARDHPTEELTIVGLPARSDEQRAQLAATLQMGRRGFAGAYDVVGMDLVFVPEFVNGGYLYPLAEQDFPRGEFLSAPWDVSLNDERLYAVPFTANVGLLYYWADELQKLRPDDDPNARWEPKNWDEVQEVAVASYEKAAGRTDGGAAPVPNGYAGQLARYEGLTVNLLEVIWGHDGDLPTGDEEVTSIQRDAASRGLGFFLTGVDKGWIDENALGYSESSSLDAFQQRKALILRHWPDAWSSLVDPKVGRVGVTPLPPKSNVLGGENLAVAACTPHRRSAMDLLTFLTGEQTQRYMFTDGLYLPTRTALYDDGSLVRPQDPVLPADLLPLLKNSLQTAHLRPAVPDYLRTSRHIQDAVHAPLEDAASLLPAPDSVELVDKLGAALRAD